MSNRRILLLVIGVAIATLCMLLSLRDTRPEAPVSSGAGLKPQLRITAFPSAVDH